MPLLRTLWPSSPAKSSSWSSHCSVRSRTRTAEPANTRAPFLPHYEGRAWRSQGSQGHSFCVLASDIVFPAHNTWSQGSWGSYLQYFLIFWWTALTVRPQPLNLPSKTGRLRACLINHRFRDDSPPARNWWSKLIFTSSPQTSCRFSTPKASSDSCLLFLGSRLKGANSSPKTASVPWILIGFFAIFITLKSHLNILTHICRTATQYLQE